MDARNKDLVNSSSGASFRKLRLSKAKVVLGRLLSAKREYEGTEVTPTQEKVKSTLTKNKENLLESRIDKLEEALQSVIQSRQQLSVPIQTHVQTEQVNHTQNSGEDWNMTANCNPESQVEVYQQDYPRSGEWNWAEEYQDSQPYTEPYPISIQIPSWPMGHPPDQPHLEHQSLEFFPPTYQPDYSSYCPSYSSHPYRTCLPETRDYCPTWSNEDWQIQNIPCYPNQTCPDQPQYQPHQ